MDVYARDGTFVGSILCGSKDAKLSAHCRWCRSAKSAGLYWGTHDMCRQDRVTRSSIEHKGRPLAYLICWLRRASLAKDQYSHLHLQSCLITKEDRLDVRSEFASDAAFKAISSKYERPRRPHEPLEWDRNP